MVVTKYVNLTDEEFLRVVIAEQQPSELVQELLRRWEKTLDKGDRK